MCENHAVKKETVQELVHELDLAVSWLEKISYAERKQNPISFEDSMPCGLIKKNETGLAYLRRILGKYGSPENGLPAFPHYEGCPSIFGQPSKR